MNDNKKTLQAYDAKAAQYIDKSPADVSKEVAQWLRTLLDGVPKSAKILEFGSGPGRDATYLLNQGYLVQCSDASTSFINVLADKGLDALSLNLLTDPIPAGYEVTFADAVLLHFSEEELKAVLKKVYEALPEGGRFGFTLKEGDFEGWTDRKLDMPRYFHQWKADEIEPILNESGFTDLSISLGTNERDDPWLFIVARK